MDDSRHIYGTRYVTGQVHRRKDLEPVPAVPGTVVRAMAVIGFALLMAGCIRLWGGAGYVKQTPEERTERVVGFDTAQVFEDKQAKGSVTAQ